MRNEVEKYRKRVEGKGLKKEYACEEVRYGKKEMKATKEREHFKRNSNIGLIDGYKQNNNFFAIWSFNGLWAASVQPKVISFISFECNVAEFD